MPSTFVLFASLICLTDHGDRQDHCVVFYIRLHQKDLLYVFSGTRTFIPPQGKKLPKPLVIPSVLLEREVIHQCGEVIDSN
jgi:hypothetical protein